MGKIPFQISAKKQGPKAIIRITGEIGFETDAEFFRSQIDELIKQGVTDAHIYINSPGGSCFDAAEIVNIISNFRGRVTGAGGALVASAATFIALNCESFEMPENGMFMIHKPNGRASGTTADITAYLKLLKDIENQYFNTYAAKTTNKEALQKQWNTADWWLTAKEAHENGFITSVKNKTTIDKETAALITACGCPHSKLPTINVNNSIKEMDLKAMARTLGLSENASEAEVQASLEAGKKAQQDLKNFKEETERREKEEQRAKIKAVVKIAIDEKRITAEIAPKWEKALTADYETNIALLENLSPVVKIPVTPGKTTASAGKVTFEGKTFEELQDENPDALATLQNSDPETFSELFEDYKKRNKLK